MPVLAIVLVLIAALCHATWNIAAKFLSGDRVAFIWAYGGISTLWGLPVGIIVLLATHGTVTPMLLIAPLVSGIIHVGYGLALQTGYAKADLGIVYPVARGAGPLLSMIIAIGVLGSGPPPSRSSARSSYSSASRSSHPCAITRPRARASCAEFSGAR